MKIHLVSMPVRDPVAAHDIYVNKLGFESKTFDADAQLAIVVAPEQPDGTELLLEPCVGSFAEAFQKSAFDANLPVMIFSVEHPDREMERLASAGIRVRPELDRPEWGLTNLFEDGCGNLLMLQKT